MNFAAIEQANEHFYSPRFEIEIEGKNLIRAGAEVLSVQVAERLSEATRFTLTLGDRFDGARSGFRWLDDPLLTPGNAVTVKMGYASNLATMIVGRIEQINPSLSVGTPSTIAVEGYDLSYDFLKKPSTQRSFVESTDSEIVEVLAAEMKLTPTIDRTEERRPKVVKKGETSYFAFLTELAQRNDYEFFAGGKRLYFVSPREDRPELFALEWGKSLVGFSPRLSTAGLVTGVTVRGWDPRTKQAIVGRAATGEERVQEGGRRKGSEIAAQLGQQAVRELTRPVSSVSEADRIARAELNRSSDRLIEGTVESVGIPELRAGITLKLDNLGRRFSGKYRVKETTHVIDGSGYRTTVEVKRNAL